MPSISRKILTRSTPLRVFKKILLTMVVVGVIYGFCLVVFKADSQTQTLKTPVATIFVTQDGFIPSEVSIKKGQVIEFVNSLPTDCPSGDPACNVWPASDPYPTHTRYPEFDPREPIAPGKSWIFTFDKPGNWGFHDHFKARSRGVVHVIE